MPASPQLDLLWRALQIREPGAADALAVAREIAAHPKLAPGDREALCEAYRFLAAAIESGARVRRELARLPLLTTDGWKTERPILAAQDKPLHDALAERLPMWIVPCALESLQQLPEALGVDIISRDALPASGLRGNEPADDALRETWERALDYLADYTADADQQLWEAGAWPRLRALKLVVAPNLALTVSADSTRSIALPQRAHVDLAANTFFFRDEDIFRERDLGGRLVAKFFERAQREIALAFVDAWRRAEEAPPTELLRLSEETAASNELERLSKRAHDSNGKKLFSAGANTQSWRARQKAPSPPPRTIKDFRNARIASIESSTGLTANR